MLQTDRIIRFDPSRSELHGTRPINSAKRDSGRRLVCGVWLHVLGDSAVSRHGGCRCRRRGFRSRCTARSVAGPTERGGAAASAGRTRSRGAEPACRRAAAPGRRRFRHPRHLFRQPRRSPCHGDVLPARRGAGRRGEARTLGQRGAGGNRILRCRDAVRSLSSDFCHGGKGIPAGQGRVAHRLDVCQHRRRPLRAADSAPARTNSRPPIAPSISSGSIGACRRTPAAKWKRPGQERGGAPRPHVMARAT